MFVLLTPASQRHIPGMSQMANSNYKVGDEAQAWVARCSDITGLSQNAIVEKCILNCKKAEETGLAVVPEVAAMVLTLLKNQVLAPNQAPIVHSARRGGPDKLPHNPVGPREKKQRSG
jgi:hypothetical protein